MPRNPKGEMNVTEIRNLVRQHNKLSIITDVDKKSRAILISEIIQRGYQLDHVLKKITKKSRTISQSTQADPKPQKATKKKKLIAAGDAPVMSTKQTVQTKAKSDAAKATRDAKTLAMIKKAKDDDPFGELKEGAFTKQMKTFGYTDVQKFADDVVAKDVGEMLKGKKVTTLLKQRAQFVINARKFKK